MPYNLLRKKPDRASLAKNVPAGGVHGYYPVLGRELDYWEKRKQTAIDFADTASFELADALIDDIGQLVNPFVALIVRDIEFNLPTSMGTEQSQENIRRDILGITALSKLCRDILAPNESWPWIVDFRALTDEERADGPGIMPEPSARDEQGRALDTRVHMSAEIADVFLGPYNSKSKRPAWYRSTEGGLYIRRGPADPTPSYLGQLVDRHLRIDFDEFQTLQPYMPSRREGPLDMRTLEL